jgi:uncharacterized protein (DUF302 family)
MPTAAYSMKVVTDLSAQDAEARVREGLAAEGFGVITEIDVAETLRVKLGVDHAPYKILGACRPQLAHDVLQLESDAGLLLPCNVVVYDDDGSTIVAALDPTTLVDTTGNPSLGPLAMDAKTRLARVISALGDQRTP